MRRLREVDQRRGTGGRPLQVLLRPTGGPHLEARFHRPARNRGEFVIGGTILNPRVKKA